MQVGGSQFYQYGSMTPKDIQSVSASHEKLAKKASSFSPEKLQETAIKVGVTALAVLFSPLLLIGAGVIATSHLLSKPGQSLWDKSMALIILPAAQRKEKEFDFRLKAFPISIDSTNGSKLDGRVLLAAGVPPEVAVTLPTVVLFNPNAGMMEDELATPIDYQKEGFNVVVFNYQGVGKSTGKIIQGSDLIDDGKNVVKALIGDGFKVNGVTLKPAAKDVLLDGSSIGGAVATAVGADHPEMMLAANRTFTRWIDAAEGLVSKYSNPLFAKLAKVILSQTTHAKMDNVDNMNTRLNSPSHSFTVIESARLGDEDGVLSKEAKLEEGRYEHSEAKFEALHEKIDHNSFIYLSRRTALSTKIQSLKSEHHYDILVLLHEIDEMFDKPAIDFGDAEKIKKLALACQNDPGSKDSELVKQQALKIKTKLEEKKSSFTSVVVEYLVKYNLVEMD